MASLSPPTSPTQTTDPSTSPHDSNSLRPDQARRSSFNFLRRQKSNEGRTGMLSKKSKGYQYPPQQAVPRVPPQLPAPAPMPTMDSFIGENNRAAFGSTAISNNHKYQTPASGYTAVSPLHQSSSPPSYGVPMPPVQPTGLSHFNNGDFVDPSARTESMTHRGRYSYASSAISASGINSPRRVRRRKDPTPFNVLVIGAQNSGKSSFIEFLKTALVTSKNGRREKSTSPPATALLVDSPFTPHYLETEVEHERIGVTIWDSQGLEKKFVDLQLREMSSFLESKFEDTFTEEQKVVRAPGVRDTHIHCVIMILDPSRLDSNLAQSRKQSKTHSTRFDEPLRLMGVLDEDLDIQVLKTLQGKTTVIPVISKADTITANHMIMLKRAVWDSLKQAKLDPMELLAFNEDDEDADQGFDERDEDAFHQDDVDDRDNSALIDDLINRSDDSLDDQPGELKAQSRPTNRHRRTPSGLGSRLSQAEGVDSNVESPYLPMSIISPDTYEPGVVGRRFPWGFADPYNADHCDFVRLKESVFSEWRAELREASREIWYEGWRTSRLNRRGHTSHGQKSSVATVTNGQRRVASGPKAVPNGQSSSPYAGGPVGVAYSNPQQQRYPPQQAQALPLSGQGSPEMVAGVYRQGVNAF